MKNSTFVIGMLTLVALGFFGTTLVHATAYDPADSATNEPAAVAADAEGDYPSRLVVPALSINANVQYTYGTTARGTMGTPTNFTDVAWYEGSVVPGATGESVIDGHVNNGLGLAGVFTDLASIKVGDDIFVTDKDGTKLHFVVANITDYDYQTIPMQDILSSTGPARLALITCDGDWVNGQNTYDERLVVTADLVGTI
jgi:LPXTG-site transpeptidase (sortase) family protein